MCVKWEAKVPTLARSLFVFICLVGKHFKHNQLRTKKPEPSKTQNKTTAAVCISRRALNSPDKIL